MESSSPHTALLEPLTRRELAILKRLSEDLSNQEIARAETLALSSVKWYVQQIYAKLGVNSRLKALARAKEMGLLGEEAASQGKPAPLYPPEQSSSYSPISKGVHRYGNRNLRR